jgi:hypothetical protein
MKLHQIIFALFFLFITVGFCFAQEKARAVDNLFNISEKVTNCEMSTIYLDELWNFRKESPSAKSFIIFVARLGTNETRREIGQRRLASIKRVFKVRYTDIPLERVIFTVGEKVKGLGRVEIYWNGELVAAILTNKNRNLCFSCCD